MKNALKTLLTLALALLCSLSIGYMGVGNESIIMVFLLGVLFTTVLTGSYIWGVSASIACVMLFNYFFTAPRHTFLIYSTRDLIMLAFFLVTAIVSGTVTSRLRREIELAGQNERTAATLYRIASGFLSASGVPSITEKGVAFVSEYAGARCDVALGDETQRQERAGDSYPIKSAAGTLGDLTVYGGAPNEQQKLIIKTVATQMGIAIDRENLVEERENIRIAMEKERQRAMLLRSVAHDLRSPLTALSGSGSLLADSYDKLTDAERRKLATDISEETVWLSDLVENILNMTRISEDSLVLKKQDEVIDDVVGAAVAHTERLLRSRKLSVSLPDEVIAVPMDARLITQVLVNLLENAVRHTPETSDISLGVRAEGNLLRVSVADTGDGVPRDMHERVFERFVTQEGAVADGRRGLGLGLAICRTIVEAHGGKISVSDNEPKGAVFSFTLPRGEA
ncbi:MAG: ATP-binding protein [Oscillospiraceae bacterium]